MKFSDLVKICSKTSETRCNIPVAKIQAFYKLLLMKNIDEAYRLKQCSKKFNLPIFSIIWALEQGE